MPQFPRSLPFMPTRIGSICGRICSLGIRTAASWDQRISRETVRRTRLDANADGILSANELAVLLKTLPDIVLAVQVPERRNGTESAESPTPTWSVETVTQVEDARAPSWSVERFPHAMKLSALHRR